MEAGGLDFWWCPGRAGGWRAGSWRGREWRAGGGRALKKRAGRETGRMCAVSCRRWAAMQSAACAMSIAICTFQELEAVSFFFFFQAEDGIRDVAVTGVQTCALPIGSSSTMSVRILTRRE